MKVDKKGARIMGKYSVVLSSDKLHAFDRREHVPGGGHIYRSRCGQVVKPAGFVTMWEPLETFGDQDRCRHCFKDHNS